MAIFTYIPSRDFSSSTNSRVRTAKFGDGYSQRVADGINIRDQKWSLTFKNRSLEDSEAIISFFEDKDSIESFTWTPTGDNSTVQVLATNWKETYTSPISRTISVTFSRVYET